MKFPSPEIEAYLHEILPARSELFQELEELAEERGFPAVGPLVGRFLHQLVKVSGAKKIFELGSGFGYSALWFATAAPEDAQIICTEYKLENAELGMKFLERAHVRHKVVYEVGDALETFQRYRETFDLIFCDIDKHQYPRALQIGLPKLKKGGLFVADNVLWSGKVADPSDQSPATEGIRTFNRMTHESPELLTVIVPLRDGVSVSYKV